jgi:hypothetical protein
VREERDREREKEREREGGWVRVNPYIYEIVVKNYYLSSIKIFVVDNVKKE